MRRLIILHFTHRVLKTAEVDSSLVLISVSLYALLCFEWPLDVAPLFLRCVLAIVVSSLFSRLLSPLCISSHHEDEVRSQHRVQVAESVFADPIHATNPKGLVQGFTATGARLNRDIERIKDLVIVYRSPVAVYCEKSTSSAPHMFSKLSRSK